MPTKTKDYPIYTYDEPAVYKDFTGGINTDPSNDHLLDNELRDCVNMTYLSGALVKRKGAKKLCDITCEDTLTNIQGIFLFTYRITYIIVAADGKLYQGIYNEDATINLTLLPIKRTRMNPSLIFDEQDAFAGLEEKNSDDIVGKTNHEGFIQTFYKNKNTGIEYAKNERGSFYDVIRGSGVLVGDVFIETRFMYEKKMLCIKEFQRDWEYPNELNNWELEGSDGLTHTYIDGNGVTQSISASNMQNVNINEYSNYNLKNFSLSELHQWETSDYTFYGGKFYHCKSPHYNRYDSILDSNFFVDISNINSSNFDENSYMFFQNYRKVEAATINNKLYIATGTRIVEVFLQNNDLVARPVMPYMCNYTEVTKIGYNYMSPYPELAVASQLDTVTTSISAIKVTKTVGNRFLLYPIMNIQKGDSIENYYFRWEKYINGIWYVVIPFHSQKTTIASENGTISIAKKNYSSIEVDDADKYLYRCTFAKSFELETTVVKEWQYGKGYNKGEYVSVGAHIYRCLISHIDNGMYYPAETFDLYGFPIVHSVVDGEQTTTISSEGRLVWEEVFDLEMLPSVEFVIQENELFDIESDYSKGDYRKVLETDSNDNQIYMVYRCLENYKADDYTFENNEFNTSATRNSDGQVVNLWSKVGEDDGTKGLEVPVYSNVYDFIVNKADGEYFGSATSVIFDNYLDVNDKFTLIHSCTKVLADGNKLLFYNDRYNSGEWFKTIINNPSYMTDRGSLSFKTNKNESLIKVMPFQGNLIVFANSENVGGSIHIVQGNGDDYDDQSGYYSPYQRRTINASISCSNADSIQVCDNIIVFKYFNRVYYINASDLNNDTVKVTPCNDRILNSSMDVNIPWDDDNCISEVNNNYYALIWNEKYKLNNDGELVLEHPGIRVKMYYKMQVQYKDGTYGVPWLRDESNLFNTKFIIYIKGKPVYLYHNILVSFYEEYYKDLEEDVEIKIRFKAVDLNYESFYKLISNCLIQFHRNQYNDVNLYAIIKNEAGHVLLNSKSKRYSVNDLGILSFNKKFHKDKNVRIGSTIQDTKLFNTINMFPCLLADTTIYAKTEGSFTLTGLTYQYTSIDAPDTNPTDTYERIIRPQEEIKDE